MALSREQESRLYTILSVVGALMIVVVLWLFSQGNRFEKYQHPQLNFKIIYPKGWEVMENYEGAAVTFRAPKQGDLDTSLAMVNVAVDPTPTGNIMTLSAFSDLAITQLRAFFKVNMEILSQEDTRLLGLPAHKFIYVIHVGMGDIKSLSVWTVSGKKSFQVTYSAEENQFDQHLKKVNKMISSFWFPRHL